MNLLEIIVLLVYASIVFELLFLHVPSVASTFQLFKRGRSEESLLVHRIKNWSVYKKIVLLVLPVIISVLVYILPLAIIVVPRLFELLAVIELPLFFHFAGAVLMLTGRVITLTANHQIRKQGVSNTDADQLIKSGLFKYSRHPLLIGMYITLLGLLIIFPSLWLLGGAIVYLSYMHFKVLLEEDHLIYKYGPKYAAYMQSTPRYL